MEQFHARLLDCFPPTQLRSDRVYGGSPERAAEDEEVQELCNLAGGKSWPELGTKDARVLSEYLALMSDEAFVAYLPAFLESAVEDLQAGFEGIMSIVVSILCPQSGDGQTNEFVLRHVTLFNDKQSQLIAEWLDRIRKLKTSDFLAKHINRALQSYWATPKGSVHSFDNSRLSSSAGPDGTDGTAVINEYYLTGELKRQYGSRTYPVGYGYDPQGRMAKMTHCAGFGAGSGTRVTTWVYNSQRGWLDKKVYPDETDNTTDHEYKACSIPVESPA